MIPENCILNANDLEEIKTICFCIPIPFYFTANNMWKTQRSGNRVWVRKDQRVTELQDHIKTHIQTLKIEIPKDIYCYSCCTAFCSSKHDWFINDRSKLRKIDLSNIWKVVEDGVFAGLGLDDSLGVHVSQSKCVLPRQIQSPPHYVAVYLTLYRLGKENANR